MRKSLSNETGRLRAHLNSAKVEAHKINRYRQTIRENALHKSKSMDKPNFEKIRTQDLHLIFLSYDSLFMNNLLEKELSNRKLPLRFRLSTRMTSKGGKTVSFYKPSRVKELHQFEIVVSQILLLNSFDHGHEDAILINGLKCENRLDALQQIMEHELLHLAEILAWGVSSCKSRNFISMGSRLFGHTDVRHNLVTPSRQARKTYNIYPGDRVCFCFDGQTLAGRVNRITKRATVLVEDDLGLPYSDGKRYSKYYIPFERLEKESL